MNKKNTIKIVSLVVIVALMACIAIVGGHVKKADNNPTDIESSMVEDEPSVTVKAEPTIDSDTTEFEVTALQTVVDTTIKMLNLQRHLASNKI